MPAALEGGVDLLTEFPVTLTQFLFYLYHNLSEFSAVFFTSHVLTALAGTLFPIVEGSPSRKEEGGIVESPTSPSGMLANYLFAFSRKGKEGML